MEEKNNVFGTVSIILGVLGLALIFCFVGIVPAVLSIIFGIICLVKKPNGTQKALSILGIVFSIIAFILLFFVGSFFSFLGNSNNTNSSGPQQQVTTKAKLEAVDLKIIEEQYSNYITGTIINTTGKEINYASIQINLYDESGAQIGTTADYISNLEIGGKWNFKAYLIEKGVTSYKVKEINYY